LKVDCLAVSGGWNPNLQLTCHHGGRPQWDSDLAAFVPGRHIPRGMAVAGAAAGKFSLGSVLKHAVDVVSAVLDDLGLTTADLQFGESDENPFAIEPFWQVKPSQGRAWVDFQNDVTTKDIELSHREGMRAMEHLKRYTTLGMATDQGKAGNVPAIAIMAELTGKSIPETGTTIYRPPYTPVAIGAFAGRARGRGFRPVRKTPSHRWAEEHGAVFVEVGAWLRAQWYARPAETHWRQSVDREVMTTRSSVGVCDVTTLGKIDIQGTGAATLLNHAYTNGFSTLPVGKVRYGLMLREDGIAYDDGTTARLGETHYVMTTTTANAGLVFRQLEFMRQCLFPDLDVHIISTTDGWAQFSIAGPNARRLLQKIIDPGFDISNEAFPFMSCAEIKICGGFAARLFRISFSGELAYEIAVPARFGHSLMDILIKAGKEFDVTPYGTEALGVMRVEKGHFAGNELTGQTTALNLGAARMLSSKKDFQGSILARRPHLNDANALKLVGVRPEDTNAKLRAGAHFLSTGNKAVLENDEGWISSCIYSPTFKSYIGLGLLKRGDERHGETVTAADPLYGSMVPVTVCSPHFYDPKGERQRG
ncbi:MAG: sarcosine oxidase subunit alpha, partial [Rhodobacteraceae bacterium]|nr:sarcosine oxidase subunit alpha [Paracoccaceae bacterium]